MAVGNKISGRLPNFFLIGAAKSGTTSVYEYLCRHPEIYMPYIKEPQFFSKKAVYNLGEDWYKGLFAEAKQYQFCGDASTTYSRWPHTLDAAELISKATPDAKFIYIMRHPVERAYSHYKHHMREGLTMTFEEALKKDTIYVDCSMYMQQIERYLRFFPRRSFLFLFQDELKISPKKVFNKIITFLNIQNVDLISDGIIESNVSGPDHYIRSKTTVILRKIPPVEYIANRIPKEWRDWMYIVLKKSYIGQRLASQAKIPKMKTETRQMLLKLFEQPNRDLEQFLGIPLPSWSS